MSCSSACSKCMRCVVSVLTVCAATNNFIMASVTGPPREFRNKTLKQSLKVNFVRSIIKSYSVFAFRALWETADEGSVRNIISGKRKQLEDVLDRTKGVALYVSCIQSFEKKEKKKNEKAPVEKEANEDGDNGAGQKNENERKYHPSLAFWVAVTDTSVDKVSYHLLFFNKPFVQNNMFKQITVYI